ncbi:TonB-dependent receptor [Acidipila sp. EB88]|uniref:TonB-dependent receptor n=1 Tax=Acidipila sp. EB88 TaxID=2305226 RepID=UPI001F18C9F9|nr:TonB-dependent receptor [Acidipila sp. EB88]
MAQATRGELRMTIVDAHGAAMSGTVEVRSLASQVDLELKTDSKGLVEAHDLPFGTYLVQVKQVQGYALPQSVEVRTASPQELTIRIDTLQLTANVTVQDTTLVDPHRASSVAEVGAQAIATRLTALPGRSVQDLVNIEPGWLYEGNAVLHPRGSEYQTQFVVDGLPLTDNRSPSFGPEIEADDADSLRIYTAGFPAEYGRKMGGVIEVNTTRDTKPGLHGSVVLSGGSYDTGAAFGRLQAVWGRNTLTTTSSGSMTSHYLNPVVPQNYTNQGTVGDFSGRYEREVATEDRFAVSLRHEFSRFQIPNELLQQEAGQRQYGDNEETTGSASYQHVFSANAVAALVGMVRDHGDGLNSKAASTPIIAAQRNAFREGYLKGSLSVHRANQEWKAGFEADTTFLHERFSDLITDPTQFDDDTPETFAFAASRPDLEQAVFVEDLIRLGNWTVSAGLRWDHYQLLLNKQAFSPRLSIGRFIPAWNMVLHASYDRVFQTPSSENILLSSSSAITSLSPEVLRLPVQPSSGNYFEGGLTKGFCQTVRLDANVYRRDVRNYADDDQLLNTGVSYPISFDKAVIYGAEGKLSLVDAHGMSGFVSYSYMVGNSWLPVTGGLFLGDDVAAATSQLNGHFPDSQDQRNTLRLRARYQVVPRVAIAGGLLYGSGLPFEYTGTAQEALAQYGAEVVDRVNFDRGRVRPNLSANASVIAALYQNESREVTLQVDGENLNNRLNVIDFGGLFSGNAIGPARSVGLRLSTRF